MTKTCTFCGSQSAFLLQIWEEVTVTVRTLTIEYSDGEEVPMCEGCYDAAHIEIARGPDVTLVDLEEEDL